MLEGEFLNVWGSSSEVGVEEKWENLLNVFHTVVVSTFPNFQSDRKADAQVWVISYHAWKRYSLGLFPCCYEPVTAFECFGVYFPVK